MKKYILKSKSLTNFARWALSVSRKTSLWTRETLPYPKVWAALTFKNIPNSYISGTKKGLFRPESVSFSKSENMMAVSNSGMFCVSLYKRKEGTRGYEKKPIHVISDKQLLSYVHDTAFSPCGKYISAVARNSNALTIFEFTETNVGEFDTKLVFSLKGSQNGLSGPAGVSFHPGGEWLAVANRDHTGISIYRRLVESSNYEWALQEVIDDNQLLQFGLTAPHGLDFSSDGNFLVVVHKRFYRSKSLIDQSSLSIFKWGKDGIENSAHPFSIYPYGRKQLHLVAFHPLNKFIAVSSEREGVDLLAWEADTGVIKKCKNISVLQIGFGAKGIAFTSQGDSVVTSSDLDEVLFFDCQLN